MEKIAFLFSGQGDQYPGMGKDLAEKYPAARISFAMCDQLRPGTSEQCFSGSEAELMETQNTQPCLFAMELAAAKVLEEKGIFAAACAGFSLGEVVAATYSGLLEEKTGFSLVCARGQLMQREAQRYETAMMAVLKLPEERVRELCREYPGIYPVNFNCPGQITVSGLASQMPDFQIAVKLAGGRAIPLKVRGAFHSPYMEAAAEDFRKILEETELFREKIPLYSNLTAKAYAGDRRELLAQQICSPVRWESLILQMREDGITEFVEIGPGKTLCNLLRKIDPTLKVRTVWECLEDTSC